MKTTILCYHKIGTELEEGRWLNCAPQTLNSHARYFARRKVPGFLPREFASRKPEGICFTFDDAYVSAVTYAPGNLEQYGYRGAFYVVPSLVGQSSLWDGDIARPLASWGELLGIQKRGHEIGNHTTTHARMSDLSEVEQLSEWRIAMQALREKGIRVGSACFPYGAFNEATLSTLAATAIPVGLMLGKRSVEPSDPIIALPRVIVAFSDSLPKLLYKINIRPKLRFGKR